MSIGMELASGAFAISELLLKILKRAKINYRFGGIQIEFDEEKSIDERIAKIDEARASMAAALTAIDQLHTEAEENKSELNKSLQKLSEAEKNKSKLEEELANIREVMQSDVTTFRKIAGIPSQEEIKKERVIGFFTGVLASVVATGVVWVVVTISPSIYKHAIEA